MKARIGLDTRMLHHTGIGTYLKGLVHSLQKTDAIQDYDLHLYGGGKTLAAFAGLSRRPFRSRIYSIEEQIEYPLRLRGCHLWHAPHYNVPYFKGKTKLVVTIHDLIHWIFRKDFFSPLQAFYAGKMLRRAAERADHIIAVSEKTKRDLIDYFEADPDRISVIYEGVSGRFTAIEDPDKIEAIKKKYRVPEKYFLYVGMLKPHKNVLWLVRLFRKLKQAGKITSALVLVGRKDKKYPAGYEELAKLKSEDDILHLPYVETDELVCLYNGATALVHPSLYEGFGLTLLEAMSCGTPVIACRSASIPEVAGEAAYLVDSCAEKDMMEALVRLERVPSVRDELRRRGRQQVLRFSWDETAIKTAAIYEKVLSS